MDKLIGLLREEQAITESVEVTSCFWDWSVLGGIFDAFVEDLPPLSFLVFEQQLRKNELHLNSFEC